MKRRNIQVLCLQETRWKGAKAREIGEGVKLFYNGEDTKRNGVAVAVADSLKDSVSAVNRVSSRIISVRIDTKEGNWTIISVYAPQASCPIYEKDEFYLRLDETIRSVPEGDYLTIAGDLNGHVGSERRGLERVHGGKGVGLRNDEGERVLALAIAHDLAVCSTFFAKRKSQKVTYSSGGKETEIDHVLVRRSSLKTVKDIKVLPGEDLAPQHRPLLADIAIDLPKKSRTRTERRIRWWKLHQSEREHLKEKIPEAGLPNPEGPIQQTWSNAVEVILRCAKETLGETRGGFRGDKEAWFWNDEVQRVVRQKKSAYRRWQKTRAPEDLAAYRTSKRLAKAAVAKAKNTEMDALYEKLDSREGEKFVFRLAKARHRATRDIGVVKSVRNSEGAILRKPGEVRRRWEEYFDGLLNEEFARQNSSQLEATAGPINLWTENEVRRAMGKMKVGKATGPDGVPIEAWKALGEYGVKWLTRFLNTVTAEGRIPDAWRKSTIVPIFKQKGDAMECSNYRGIRELVPISQKQFGFMPERSTTDAIFIARQVMEKYREKRRPCYIAFLDLEKAFDRLPRQVLWRALRKRKVPEHLVSLVKDMYDGSTTTIRTPHGQTGAIDVTVGVHQGSALSPFLFLLTMDVITEELMDGPLKTILYADDIALIAESKDELQDKLQNWQRVLAESGLRLNVKKTKFLSSEEGTESIVDGRGEDIEKVQDFRYLGSDLAADGSVDQAVKSRINAAWMKWRESTGILCDRRCSRTLKGKVYRAVVRPTMLYGSECWPVSKFHEGQLHSAEMRMLRWACGWTRLDRVRNEDVRTAMQTAPIQLKMREQRLRWFGHVLRRPQSHPIREAMEFEAQGKRPRGAPKKRWRDVIKKDLAETKVTAEDAVDRMKWRRLTRTADPATARD
ncbi:hypothetical protein V3C99_003389 [Haemonchus contortus]